MKTATFNKFRGLVYERIGIRLGETKEALVESRIGKRLRALELPTPESYLLHLENPDHQDELIHFIDAISTNVTSFFREPDHFEFLDSKLKEWARAGQRQFTIWCGAASTGEEPYTLSMTALQALASYADTSVRILATDISTRVLDQCRAGTYKKEKLEGIPPNLQTRYFHKVQGNGSDELYSASKELRAPLTFARLNLASPPFSMKGPMDVIFIRNVMIYFDDEVRLPLLDEAHRMLKPGGYLVVGHSEGLTGLVSNFKLVQSSVYVRP